MSRILVPVDFSEFSRAALDWAVRLSRPARASVDVLHVAPAPPYAPERMAVKLGEGREAMTFEKLAREDAEERMEMFLDKLELPQGITLGVTIDFGDPLSRILDAARTHDLIVVGTHGRTGLTHFVLGSVAEKVLRHAGKPVITVRGHRAPMPRPGAQRRAEAANAPDAPDTRAATGSNPPARAALLGRILVAVDFSPSSRAALELAGTLAAQHEASIDVVHTVTHVPVDGSDLLVVSFNRDSDTPFKDWAKSAARVAMDEVLASVALPVPVQSSVVIGEPVQTILELARVERYDLIALGTRGKSGVERLLVGSVAEKIVRRAECPVLTLRAGDS